jgi:SAM-dependent methyltransferase
VTSQDVPPREPPTGAKGTGHDQLRIDTTIAHPARVYNYWLGGKDNYQVDREAGAAAVKANPNVLPGVRANRAFLGRAVEYLVADAGIRQFLDIGTGLPTADNTHEVAQAIAPETKVVYVDNDPMVLAHARALLTTTREGATTYIDADVRDTATILDGAADLLDLSQPVAVMMLMIMPYVPDSDNPHQIVAQLMDAMAPGSYLALSEMTRDIDTNRTARATSHLNNRLGPTQITLRSRAEIVKYFDGLDFIEPGLVTTPEWRATPDPDHIIPCYAGVARKPGP